MRAQPSLPYSRGSEFSSNVGRPAAPGSCEKIDLAAPSRVSPLVKGDSRGFVQRTCDHPLAPSLSRRGVKAEFFTAPRFKGESAFSSSGKSSIFIGRDATQMAPRTL
jgi:hypothetical protein